MMELLVIADDFTGALDTGVKFSKQSIDVNVTTDIEYDFSETEEGSVLVLDSETRHVKAEEAGDIILKIVKRACGAGVPYIYKKTDSALRGNIGAELWAVLKETGEKELSFVPAFPDMKRTTVNGIQYIDSVPVNESVFGQDPFEPVKHQAVADIIHEQSDVATCCIPIGKSSDREKRGFVAIYDAVSTSDVKKLAENLSKENKLRAMAGCAGFASALPSVLKLKGRKNEALSGLGKGLLVVCGSLNPVTKSQLDYAEEHGFERIYLSPEQKIAVNHWQGVRGRKELEELALKSMEREFLVIDGNDPPGSDATAGYIRENRISVEEMRSRVTRSFGHMMKNILDRGFSGTLMIMGGDTLLGVLSEIGVVKVRPVAELVPGTVLSDFDYGGRSLRIISKSGGFGQSSLIMDLVSEYML